MLLKLHFLFLLILIQGTSHAAFPVRVQQSASHILTTETLPEADKGKGTLGVLSFIAGLLCFPAIGVGVNVLNLNNTLVALGIAGVLCIAAITLGVLGMNKKKRRLAIAGMVMGIAVLLPVLLFLSQAF
jgi:hypothetical protein